MKRKKKKSCAKGGKLQPENLHQTLYGFGYDIHFKQTLKDIAKMEKAQNKMLKSSRADTVKETKVLSRKECLKKFGKHGDVLEGKGGPEDMILKM